MTISSTLRESVFSKKFLFQTCAIGIYLIILGEGAIWLIAPLLVIYGNFLKKQINESNGIKKYILQFILFFPIMSVLVASTHFVHSIGNGNLLAIEGGIVFGLLMCLGSLLRDKLL